MVARIGLAGLAALLLAGGAEAAMSVGGFEMPHPDARLGEASVRWQVREGQEVDFTISYCPACRNPDPKFFRFTIDPALAERVDALVPDDMVEAATRAPCTLPYGEAGWTRRVDVTTRRSNGGITHRAFFQTCESPELATLRKRLQEAALVLLDEAKRQGLKPEPGW